MERLHKVLSAAGVTSRRKAEEMIARGEVTVNGHVAIVGEQVERACDIIVVSGRLLPATPRLYLAVHKPAGYITSLRSMRGEPTICDLIPALERVFPVGRLDKETSGLLLLTNDGDWANLVTHPRYRVQKEYLALVQGNPNREAMRQLRGGIELSDGTVAAPATIRFIRESGRNALLSITVIEGKKRQIRLMGARVGHRVIRLERTRIGPILLTGLPAGEWRNLRQNEVEMIDDVARRNVAGYGASPRLAHRD